MENGEWAEEKGVGVDWEWSEGKGVQGRDVDGLRWGEEVGGGGGSGMG